MKVVITGASGFLGRELLRQARTNDELEIVAVTSRSEFIADHFGVRAIDGESFAMRDSLMRSADVLLNCAFPRSEDPLVMASGMRYIEKIARSVNDLEFGSVINVSSQSVYSQFRGQPATERTEICLESKYSVAKYATEMLFDSYCLNIPCTHIRLASLIGVCFDQRLPNKLAKKMCRRERVTIHDEGQRYGYMDVRDAASALLRLVLSDSKEWCHEYVLGSKGACSISEIASISQRLVGRLSGVDPDASISVSPADRRLNTEVDASLFYRSFDWLPQHSVEDSIEEIAVHAVRAWNKEMGGGAYMTDSIVS